MRSRGARTKHAVVEEGLRLLIQTKSQYPPFARQGDLAGAHVIGATKMGYPVVHIRPTRGFASLGIRELWQSRELLYFLAWRDVKVRYAQTALGISWAVIQPFLTMVVFSLF